MSLAEIAGSPLATKMSTPIVPTQPVVYMSSLKTNVPVLTKTGIQNIGIKETYYPPTGPVKTFTIPTKTTTTVAPVQPQAPVTTQAKEGFTGSDLLGALSLTGKTAIGSTPLGAGLNLIGSIWGLAGTLAGGTTKPVTVVEPKTSTTVNISQNPLMGVVKAVAEQNLGNWYMQNPAVQKMLAVARTGMTVNALNKAGYGNVYLPGSEIPISQEVAPIIYNKEVGDVSKIAQQRWGESQNLLQPLQKGTVEGIVAKEYLQNTTTIYERIIERFTEYINQGGGGTPEAPKGTDWGLIAIIGIAAIAGVILLSSFIKGGK